MGFFKKVMEQFKKDNKVANNTPNALINHLEKNIGLEVKNKENVKEHLCIQSEFCLIYYPNKKDDDIRISFDVKSTPEQVAFIMSELVNIYGKGNINILKSHYHYGTEEDSILVGEEAYKKYFEQLTGVVATNIAQQQFDFLKILEQSDPGRAQ